MIPNNPGGKDASRRILEKINMVSWDYFVGFEREPESLDLFLDRQGYEAIPNEEDNNGRYYESREGGLVELFFYDATDVEKGEVPDWKRSGFDISHELMITTKDPAFADNALRLAEETTKKYNGVLYDPNVGEYSRREEL